MTTEEIDICYEKKMLSLAKAVISASPYYSEAKKDSIIMNDEMSDEDVKMPYETRANQVEMFLRVNKLRIPAEWFTDDALRITDITAEEWKAIKDGPSQAFIDSPFFEGRHKVKTNEPMTLNEFNILSFEDKYTALDNGVLLYNDGTKEEVYECYSFDTFFVEVVYDNENSIIEFRSYKTGEMLNNFSGKIEPF